jgi:NADPH-dependent 2,4-dienoyl-CoA reductase/sulfur reductase-like enzyme
MSDTFVVVAVTPGEFRDERYDDLRTGHEVVGIDPEAETVTVEGGGETFDQPYTISSSRRARAPSNPSGTKYSRRRKPSRES